VPGATHPFVLMMTPEAGPVRHDPVPSGTAAPPPKPSVAPSSGHCDPTHREAHRISDGPSISRAGPSGTSRSKKDPTQMQADARGSA
jgi:hypothetical protein